MAKRPVFIPLKEGIVSVKILMIDFIWHSGYALSQKQKSIKSLHESARQYGLSNLLEISSKSYCEEGKKLSAFNLSTSSLINKKRFSVEIAFQSSKIFEKGGPYIDLMEVDSRTAKKDPRLKSSGKIIGFNFFNKKFPSDPPTYFYDWLYINTLLKNEELIPLLEQYDGFTDIEFNPDKSINCQAYSVALFSSLIRKEKNFYRLKDPEYFLYLCNSEYQKRWESGNRNYEIELT